MTEYLQQPQPVPQNWEYGEESEFNIGVYNASYVQDMGAIISHGENAISSVTFFYIPEDGSMPYKDFEIQLSNYVIPDIIEINEPDVNASVVGIYDYNEKGERIDINLLFPGEDINVRLDYEGTYGNWDLEKIWLQDPNGEILDPQIHPIESLNRVVSYTEAKPTAILEQPTNGKDVFDYVNSTSESGDPSLIAEYWPWIAAGILSLIPIVGGVAWARKRGVTDMSWPTSF